MPGKQGQVLTALAAAAITAGLFSCAAQEASEVSQAPQSDRQQPAGEAASNRTETVPFTQERLQQLRLPEGFSVNVFARDLGNPRMMVVEPDGTVYVSRPASGDVLALRDTDGDGQAEQRTTALDGLRQVHGLALHAGKLYAATINSVYVADIENGQVGSPRRIVSNLPAGGQHPKRTLGLGPDDRLFISVGSSCNACREENPEHATILTTDLSGNNRAVFAQGLRNTIGFGWHPQTGELWGMDIGSDWVGGDVPPEELNRLEEGRHYGWPWCYADGQVDLTVSSPPPGNASKEAFCARTAAPALTYQAHASPIGMAFYTAEQFPAAYQGDAFVAMRGSWNRRPAVGYKVVRIDFEGGQPVRMEDFMTGFLLEDRQSHFARPAGVAVAADGSLLVSDDQNGIIYRIRYDDSSR